MNYKKGIVIGDAHVEPDQSLERFRWLGNYIKKESPDFIIIIGDFITLDSLSYHIRQKRYLLENQRYKKDIEIGNEALDLIDEAIRINYNNQKKRKKSVYKPFKSYIFGNHEDRLAKFFESSPEFQGSLDVAIDLDLYKRDYYIVPYGEYLYLEDVGFTHIPFNKLKPISGIDICKKASNVTIKSCVFGHTHELNYGGFNLAGMENTQQILNVGCFFTHIPYYVNKCQRNYWEGIIELELLGKGKFDYETISLKRLEKMYG